jgi:hypothetical protein
MEFEEFSKRDANKGKSNQTHKSCGISQDWSWHKPSSSTTTSVVQLAHQSSVADDV